MVSEVGELTPLDPLDVDCSNLANKWQQWRQHFELFTLASGLSKKDPKIQSAMLLHVISPAALEVYNTFIWENENNKQKGQCDSSKIRRSLYPALEHHLGKTRVQYTQSM